MKELTKFALMLLSGAFALGFTSCSDDDDNTTADATQLDVTSSSSTLSNIVTNYVDNVVNQLMPTCTMQLLSFTLLALP